MKRFLKKVNRGLVLGAALLLLLVGFIVLKEVQFRMEAPVIRDTARDAIEVMLELNLSDEDTALGQVRSEEAQASGMARLETVLAQYWDADGSSSYYVNVGTVRSSFEDYLDDPVHARFYEIDLSISNSEITFRQNGTDYAIAFLEINNLAARYDGDGEYLFYGEYYGSDDTVGAVSGQYIGNYSGYVEMEMHRTGGEWRVCGMSIYLNMNNKTVADIGTGGEK